MKLLNKISVRRAFRTLFLATAMGSTVALSGCSSLNMDSLMSGASKAIEAATISDGQIQNYVHEYIVYSDKQIRWHPLPTNMRSDSQDSPTVLIQSMVYR